MVVCSAASSRQSGEAVQVSSAEGSVGIVSLPVSSFAFDSLFLLLIEKDAMV